jgi:hypothetical protein
MSHFFSKTAILTFNQIHSSLILDDFQSFIEAKKSLIQRLSTKV